MTYRPFISNDVKINSPKIYQPQLIRTRINVDTYLEQIAVKMPTCIDAIVEKFKCNYKNKYKQKRDQRLSTRI